MTTPLNSTDSYLAFPEIDVNGDSQLEKFESAEDKIYSVSRKLNDHPGSCGLITLDGIVRIDSDLIASTLLVYTPGVFAIQKLGSKSFGAAPKLISYNQVDVPVDCYFRRDVSLSLYSLTEEVELAERERLSELANKLSQNILHFYSECPEVKPPVMARLEKSLQKAAKVTDENSLREILEEIRSMADQSDGEISPYFIDDPFSTDTLSDSSQLIRVCFT